MEASNTCRTCMAPCKKFHSINSPTVNSKKLRLLDVVKVLGEYEVSSNDNMPQYVCSLCYRDLNYLYEFAMRCKNSEATLGQIFKNGKNSKNGKNGKDIDNNNAAQTVGSYEKIEIIDIENLKEESNSPCGKNVRYHRTELKIENSPKKTFKISEGYLETSDPLVLDELDNIIVESPSSIVDFDLDGNADNHSLLEYEIVSDSEFKDDFPDEYFDECSQNQNETNAKYAKKRRREAPRVNVNTFGDYNCDKCGKNFHFETLYIAHMQLHDTNRRYECGICKYRFDDSAILHHHMNSHKTDQLYKCPKCTQTFGTKEGMERHAIWHNIKFARSYDCPICHKQFKTSAILKTHSYTHLEPSDKPYLCEFCARTFSQPTHLQVHLRTHTGEKPFTCKKCLRRFAGKWNFLKHETICKA